VAFNNSNLHDKSVLPGIMTTLVIFRQLSKVTP
jgi:hypothetical protein